MSPISLSFASRSWSANSLCLIMESGQGRSDNIMPELGRFFEVPYSVVLRSFLSSLVHNIADTKRDAAQK